MATPLVASPYGRDMSCTTHIRRGRMVSGGQLLGEASFRRLTTERGTLAYDPTYGLPIVYWLNADVDADELASIPAQIRQELTKDQRIDRVAVNVTVEASESSARALTIEIDGLGKNGETFSLAIHIDDVRVELLEMKG